MSNEIVNPNELTPMAMIAQAQANKASIEEIKAFMDLQERWEKSEAKKKYIRAFASAQTKIDTVVKTKLNPQTHSKYAELSDIIETTKPVYTAEGFAIIFYEGDAPKPETSIRICADVLHEAGHKETYHYDVPLDGVGIKGNANMTAIHGKASSTSYGRRYLMCMIWNVATGDDNDGNGSGGKIMSEEIKGEWIQQINATMNKDELLAVFKNAYAAAVKSGDGKALLDIIKTKENKQSTFSAVEKKVKS
jgi:hypothetical protein